MQDYVGEQHINPAAYHTIKEMRLWAFFYHSSVNIGQENPKPYNLGFMVALSNTRSSLSAVRGAHCRIRCALCDAVYKANIRFCWFY